MEEERRKRDEGRENTQSDKSTLYSKGIRKDEIGIYRIILILRELVARMSTTSSTSMDSSRCTCIEARPFRRSSFITDRRYFFKRFNTLKVRSGEAVVTGRVEKIWSRTDIFG